MYIHISRYIYTDKHLWWIYYFDCTLETQRTCEQLTWVSQQSPSGTEGLDIMANH